MGKLFLLAVLEKRKRDVGFYSVLLGKSQCKAFSKILVILDCIREHKRWFFASKIISSTIKISHVKCKAWERPCIATSRQKNLFHITRKQRICTVCLISTQVSSLFKKFSFCFSEQLIHSSIENYSNLIL